MKTPQPDQISRGIPTDRDQLAALVRELLDESGMVKPSVQLYASGPEAPAPRVEVIGLELIDGKAPTEFRLFRAGENASTKGVFLFDEEAAASVMGFWSARRIDLMMDYEHMSLWKPPIIAPASCKRFIPEIRNGELWATQCSWTNRARAMLEEGEIRFHSPAFDFDKATGRVLRLINVALTNNPALNDLTPLVAASGGTPAGLMAASSTTPTEATPMKVKKMKCSTATCSRVTTLVDTDGDADQDTMKAADGEEAYCAQCRASAVLSGVGQKVMMGIGLTAETEEAVALSAAGELVTARTELLTATGQKTVGAALGALSAMKAQAEKVEPLEKELGELRTAMLTADLGQVLDQYGRDGKLSPAQRAAIEAKAKDAAGKVTAEGVKFAREWLSGISGPIVETEERKGQEHSLALDPEEVKIAKTLGQSPDAYAKWKADRLRAQAGA